MGNFITGEISRLTLIAVITTATLHHPVRIQVTLYGGAHA